MVNKKEYNVILHLESIRKTVEAESEQHAQEIAIDLFRSKHPHLTVEGSEIDDYEEEK